MRMHDHTLGRCRKQQRECGWPHIYIDIYSYICTYIHVYVYIYVCLCIFCTNTHLNLFGCAAILWAATGKQQRVCGEPHVDVYYKYTHVCIYIYTFICIFCTNTHINVLGCTAILWAAASKQQRICGGPHGFRFNAHMDRFAGAVP